MSFELEQIDPFDVNYQDFWIKIEHLARYIFVYDMLKNQNKKQNVLDIACGFGYGLKELSPVSEKIIGVDINDIAIAKAQEINKNIANVEIIKWDLEKNINQQIFSENMFDNIISFETLEHLKNPMDVINIFYHLLKNNGQLILSVPNKRFESLDENGNPRNRYHKQVFSEFEIEDMLRVAGFKIIDKYGQAFLNKLIKKEHQLIRKKRIASRLSHLKKLSEKEYIRACAYLFAYPDKNDIKSSYSRIYVVSKIGVLSEKNMD